MTSGARERRPVGVLALQGSFDLHVRALERLGVEVREVRRREDLDGIGALIIPGGESTTMSRLAREYGLLPELERALAGGLPAFGTCAGAILLGKGDDRPPRFGVVDAHVDRNAYGRQVDSFTSPVEVEGLDEPFHGIFIRAPRFRVDETAKVEILGRAGDEPVLIRGGGVWIASFHPELTSDLRIHRAFLESAGYEFSDARASGGTEREDRGSGADATQDATDGRMGRAR